MLSAYPPKIWEPPKININSPVAVQTNRIFIYVLGQDKYKVDWHGCFVLPLSFQLFSRKKRISATRVFTINREAVRVFQGG